MTWSNRFRLFGGFLVVVFVVAACTFVLGQRESQTASRSASIEAISYSVGTEYAGTVVEQSVEQGDQVDEGDPLLSIQSTALLRDLDSDNDVPESTAYKISKDGIVTLVATEPGIVSSIDAKVGGFASAGQPLATIDQRGSLYVLADFRIDPYDFARIEDGAKVDIILPNHQRLAGTVLRVKVDTVSGKADTEVEVTSDALVSGEQDGLVAPGTPVTAIMHLREDGPLAGLKNSMFELLEQVGI
jgi:multidrug resistance efflux pump